MTPDPFSRVRGCLTGIAVGDAIGKQTEGLSRANIAHWYPGGIRGFEGEPGAVIPRYAGNTNRRWLVGETTDDTERTIAVGRAVIRDRAVRHESVGRELLTCTKCVHPGIRSLWELHQSGDPARIARCHDGCGAAIRVAPVAILFASHRLDDLVEGAWHAAIPTHGGSLALAAAAATAAAISASIDGACAPDIVDHAITAAAHAERRWPGRVEGPRFTDAVRTLCDDVRGSDVNADTLSARHFPNVPLTIVPLALALATAMRSARSAILMAANIGGDGDSVASIAGGILGARFPESVPADWYAVVRGVNAHDLEPLARELAALRT
jgi:ADP-ribosylglycohydrolase